MSGERFWLLVLVVGALLVLVAVAGLALVAITQQWVVWPIGTTAYTRAGLAGGVGAIGLGGWGLVRLTRPRSSRAGQRRRRPDPSRDDATTVQFRSATVPVRPRGAGLAVTAVIPAVSSATPRRRHPVPVGSNPPLDSAGATQVFPSVSEGGDGERAPAALPAAETQIIARVRAEVRHLGATPAVAAGSVTAGGDQGWSAAGRHPRAHEFGPRRSRAGGQSEITHH